MLLLKHYISNSIQRLCPVKVVNVVAFRLMLWFCALHHHVSFIHKFIRPLIGLKMKNKRKNLENRTTLCLRNIKTFKYISTIFNLHMLFIILGRLTEKHSHLIYTYIRKLTRNLHVVTDNNYCFAAKFSACGPHLLKAYNTVHHCASL